MNKSSLMSKAHSIAKNLIGDYAARLSMALKMVWAEIKKGVKKMVELVGTEKQVAWATEIKKELIEKMENYRESYKKATTMKRNFILNFMEELKLMFKDGKPSSNEEIEMCFCKIIDKAIANIEAETSAKRLINLKTGGLMTYEIIKECI